jgi:hypothetical protein
MVACDNLSIFWYLGLVGQISGRNDRFLLEELLI